MRPQHSVDDAVVCHEMADLPAKDPFRVTFIEAAKEMDHSQGLITDQDAQCYIGDPVTYLILYAGWQIANHRNQDRNNQIAAITDKPIKSVDRADSVETILTNVLAAVRQIAYYLEAIDYTKIDDTEKHIPVQFSHLRWVPDHLR